MSGPDVWGPHGWKFIHFVTLGYPNNPSTDDKKKYKKFFELIYTVLPCRLCANHYLENLKINPLSDNVLSNKQELIEWGIKMHNSVNKSHGKRLYNYKDGLAEIIKNSDPIYIPNNININNKNKNSNSGIYKILYIFIFLLIGFFVGKFMNKKK